jgi:hypothetical protein
MPLPPTRPKLRKREIAFALAIGALAAGGGAAVISAINDDASAPPRYVAAPERQSYEVEEFAEISSTGPQDVIITIGESYSVRAEGAPEALGQLEAVVEDGELVIRPTRSFRGDWGRFSSVTYHVTMPQLEAVTLAGSGDIRVDRVEGDEFEGAINGSGALTIGDIDVDEADFSIGGSGNVIAAGTARETRVSIGGTGEVEAAGLRSETARVTIGGVGDVALTVDEEAEISMAGGGNVEITGPARCSVSRFGIGEVRCNGVNVE